MEDDLRGLITKIRSYNPEADLNLVEKAYALAEKSYDDQMRRNGETLLSHCLAVANLVADIGLDENSVSTALLHEMIRKGNYTKDQLEKEFNPQLAFFVETLNQLSLTQLYPNDQKLLDNVKKIFFYFAKDSRVALVRLADRVDNIKTISGLSKKDQAWAVRQTLNFYAPIADILGVYYYKYQMEDYAFVVLHPELYKSINNQLAHDKPEMERAIEEIRRRVWKKLVLEGITSARIFGRAKHIYSIWKKLLRYQKEGKVKDLLARRLYDQMAMMIITQNVPECYQALGVINQMFATFTEEFDDYIAKPKPNGYRAIHTIIKDEAGRVFEIQIKTAQMHQENEFGQAAHFHYKTEGKRTASAVSTEEITWTKQLSDWSNANVQEIFGDKIFVFTPKGDVYELPVGSTPIDFAYAVHSDLGNKASGARINGKMTSLETKLRSGQTVEILVDKNRKSPSQKWLEFVVSDRAKVEISKMLRRA